MVAKVLTPSEHELIERREALLRRAGVTIEELRERRDSYSLTGEEWEILGALEDIEFLLKG